MDYSYDSTYTNDPASAAAAAAITGVVLFMLFLFVVASYAIGAFLLGRIFKKAGEPQWIAWVPIYNVWKLLELGGQQGFWSILAFIPFVNIVSVIFIYIAMYTIGLKLGKPGAFVLWAIFLPVVWLIWLGFDDSQWPREKKSTPAKTSTAKKSTAKKSAK